MIFQQTKGTSSVLDPTLMTVNLSEFKSQNWMQMCIEHICGSVQRRQFVSDISGTFALFQRLSSYNCVYLTLDFQINIIVSRAVSAIGHLASWRQSSLISSQTRSMRIESNWASHSQWTVAARIFYSYFSSEIQRRWRKGRIVWKSPEALGLQQ